MFNFHRLHLRAQERLKLYAGEYWRRKTASSCAGTSQKLHSRCV